VALCKWLEQTAVGSSVRESVWLFPAIETAHLLGMAVLLVTIGVFDLRLLGWVMRHERISALGRRLLPWVWTAFAVQVITGMLLFSSEAIKVYTNPAFRLKMLLIVLAGVQALVFDRTVFRGVEQWEQGGALPVRAKVSGLISLLLWSGVVAAGRFIGFV
jgi:hypothetical protein